MQTQKVIPLSPGTTDQKDARKKDKKTVLTKSDENLDSCSEVQISIRAEDVQSQRDGYARRPAFAVSLRCRLLVLSDTLLRSRFSSFEPKSLANLSATCRRLH